MMKAITIWQPFASLKACGAKQFETRSWYTSYRGQIAIHAAQRPFRTGSYLDRDLHHFADALDLPDIYSFDKLPRGAVIATGELVGCHEIVLLGCCGSSKRSIAWVDENQTPHYPSAKEISFGDWTPGRYAWEITNVHMLPEPVSAKGKQRLWNWGVSA